MVNEQAAALRAFDSVAPTFDERFGQLLSVAAQRRAVRQQLLRSFPIGGKLLEIGGGTGEDAIFLGKRGRHVLLTDGAEGMVAVAAKKIAMRDCERVVRVRSLRIENLSDLLDDQTIEVPFDGVYSNFASLNCVENLAPVGRALAALIKPGGLALLVMFGSCSFGEIIVQLSQGNFANAFRRLRSGSAVNARLNGHDFPVWYPNPLSVARAFQPYFSLRTKRGIGVFVPPSAAEPGISRFPRVVNALEGLDRVVGRPLAFLGDHILLTFTRTGVSVA